MTILKRWLAKTSDLFVVRGHPGTRQTANALPCAPTETSGPQQGDLAEELWALRCALALDEKNPHLHHKLGLLLLQEGKLWRAREAFLHTLFLDACLEPPKEKLKEIDVGLVGVEFDLKSAQAAFEANNLELSWKLAESVIRRVPDHPDAHLIHVAILRAKNQPEEALAALLKVLEDAPRHLPALRWLDTLTVDTTEPIILPAALRDYRPLPIPERPFVTVTICSFNQEKYIRDCLDSVFAQTWSPLEILIGDDGSQDKTRKIIDERVTNYHGPHDIKILGHAKNLGFSGRANWLDGYRKASGRLVFQFSGDDVMHAEMVERTVKKWQATGASLLTVNANYIDGESRPCGRRLPQNHLIDSSLERLARDGVNDCVFGAGTAYDTQMFEVFPNGLGTPPRHLGTQDIMLPFYASLLTGCVLLPEPLMNYRIHGAQFSLSVAHRQAREVDKVVLEEKMWWGHLAHSLLMRHTIKRAAEIYPSKYSELKTRLLPLLEHQTSLMAQRETQARQTLYYKYNIDRLS